MHSALKTADPSEFPQIKFLLAYCFSKVSNTENEKIYLKDYFENYPDNTLTIDFLPKPIVFKIEDYHSLRIANYPLTGKFVIKNNTFPISQIPTSFELQFESRISCYYKLFLSNSIISEGPLINGINTIRLPPLDLLRKQRFNEFFLEFNSSTFSVRKNLILSVIFDFAPGSEIRDGKVKIQDKDFKNEEIVKIDIIRKKSFNKKHFFRHSLPYMVAGGALFTSNELLLKKPLNDETFSVKSDPLYFATYHAIKNVSISLSLISLVNLFRSFETKISETRNVIKDSSAINYNESLRDEIQKAERMTSVKLNLEVKTL